MNAPRDALLTVEANRRMFDRIARRYDRMNAIVSLGQDRRWRRQAVAALAPRPGGRYLDIGCGTGEMAVEICRQAPGAVVVGIDPAEKMLDIARNKIARAGLGDRITFHSASGLNIPYNDHAFDGTVCAFCLRNMTDRAKAFAEMHRVIAPGAPAVILELAVPPNPLVRAGYYLYSRTVVPLAGALIARSTDAYRYLVESIRQFPRPHRLVEQMSAAAFDETRYDSLGLGTVIVLTGRAGLTAR